MVLHVANDPHCARSRGLCPRILRPSCGQAAHVLNLTQTEATPASNTHTPCQAHHELKHQCQPAGWLVIQHLQQLDDVGVRGQPPQCLDLPQVVDLHTGMQGSSQYATADTTHRPEAKLDTQGRALRLKQGLKR